MLVVNNRTEMYWVRIFNGQMEPIINFFDAHVHCKKEKKIQKNKINNGLCMRICLLSIPASLG